MPWPEIPACSRVPYTNVSVCPRGTSWPNTPLPAQTPGRPACMCVGTERLFFISKKI